ncbi:PAS domain-containing protein [Aquibium sp. LZ166]|uniref:Blue-light-activated histidine kinase n=1 Tax=Aquibium pacificus TaxID=3153579 RepID=A0ABV3SP53_9HYPH
MFKGSPNAYVIFDEALNIVTCNDAYLSAVGRGSSEEIVGRYLFDAFPSPTESASYNLLRRSLDKVLMTHERDYIAVIPYDTSQPGDPPNMRYWSATHTPIFDGNGQFRFILQHTVDITELQKLRERGARELIAEAGVFQRAQEVQAANQAISAESELLRDMFKQAPGFIGILGGPGHHFILANDAYERLVGGRSLVGLTVAEALPEVVGQGFIDLLDAVYRSGEPYVGTGIPVSLRQQHGAEPQKRYVDFVYQPIFTEDDEVSGIFVQGHDVTEKVEAEQLQTLRRKELGHRLKNQLAMIQAIVNQTFRSSTDMKTAGTTISERLHALAGAHESLISGSSGKTTVGEIVRKTMEVHDDLRMPRIRAEGPQMQIASRPALSLSLVLHELSTNATKYGALSGEGGNVTLTWGIDTEGDAPRFTMTWREEGGPPVRTPARSGAGTRLIKAGLSGTIDCRVEMEFEPDGIVCRITADLESFNNEEA